ncbi:hypothetical protein [Sulfurirhabdus autotrophica]|uniref:Molecular chaperone n=1 Tax=Sulfurirhabdus autotrophica TaxID=1706046 RepID=A0A4R3Y881_9PROT|nr:hypothetical protein [Sulfurirhabdus autotrophica]TCV88097.1 hypothetical protein EDC63_10454 [Sulfurirhabdus autotrophica]
MDDGISLKIKDAKACKQWLASLPLTNVSIAHKEISNQLTQLNQFTLTPLERLKINEQLREPVAFLQGELAKKYAGKPIPFGDAERSAWNQAIALWQIMGEAYQLCLQGCLEGDAEVSEHVALIVHRCLRFNGWIMLEHYRAHRQTEAVLWYQVHTLYAYAEENKFAGKAVKDSLNQMSDASSCTAMYVQILLTSLANPYQLSARQLLLLDRWLDKWGLRVPLVMSNPSQAGFPSVVVDIESSAPPMMGNPEFQIKSPRYLETTRLAEGLRKRIKFLRKGGAPEELDVGEACIQPACEAFLMTLYREWCEAPTNRNFERNVSRAMAQVCLGMAAMHFFINDEKQLEHPKKPASIGYQETQELQLFGRIMERNDDRPSSAQLGFSLETWSIQDESALGFGLKRQENGKYQVSHNQLVALRPDDCKQFVLGVVRWLSHTLTGELQLGIRTLPGVPVAIGVKPVVLNQSAQNEFVPVLRLPEVPALQSKESLIIPLGWFQPGKLLEVLSQPKQTYKLQSLLEKGCDFERVSFIIV